MAQLKLKRDFVVETKGHCFLCLSRTSSTKSIKESFPIQPFQSLQCFSQYLNMDMRKVFLDEDADIPSHLLATVRESKLKVELCEECVSINGRFSGLYRQLERIEMEMQANLNIIVSKLKKESNAVIPGDFRTIPGEEGTGKMQVVEALRKEALQKCSQKLATVFPRCSVPNLTLNQLRSKIKRVKHEWNKNRPQVSASNIIDTKIMSAVSPSASQVAYDDADYNDHQGVERWEIKSEPASSPIADAWENFGDDDGEILQDFDGSDLQTQPNCDGRQKTIRSERSKQIREDSKDIPAPLKVIGVTGNTAKQFQINPETGKHQCQLCPKEYSCAESFNNHFKSVHLKVRFKCILCGKDFSYKHHYEEHYQNTHLRIRYKCPHCHKLFRQKRFLEKHQKSYHAMEQQ